MEENRRKLQTDYDSSSYLFELIVGLTNSYPHIILTLQKKKEVVVVPTENDMEFIIQNTGVKMKF